MAIQTVINEFPQDLQLPMMHLVEELHREGIVRADFIDLKQNVAELAEAQNRTEKKVEELAEAQNRTEKKLGELADAQIRMEQELGDLGKKLETGFKNVYVRINTLIHQVRPIE